MTHKDLNILNSVIGRLEMVVREANKQIPGFSATWLSDNLVDEAREILRKAKQTETAK